MKKTIILFVFISLNIFGQNLITNIEARKTLSLNGDWKIIIDPYENGYYSYRYTPLSDGFFKNAKPQNESDRIEYSFDESISLNVPGDWNTQREDLYFYEGTIWYKKSFDYNLKINRRLFIYFGAVNYNAKVYLNGEFLGEHTGGFTPFNFEITKLVKDKDNLIVVKVDNKRFADGVPTLNTDWWNYGGITRDVKLVEVPRNFIEDYSIHLKNNLTSKISGFVKINGKGQAEIIKIEIPELEIEKEIPLTPKGNCKFEAETKPELWSPENPKLYDVKITFGDETIKDKIGFRFIEVEGNEIKLNGKSVFLKGISMHEEAPFRTGRANTNEDVLTMLNWAKELGCNFVRLAHYPHNEKIVRLADELGIMLWSEIPVYWTIEWENESTYNLAEQQLTEMITRDKNRAAVIIWSVANETPRNEARLKFLSNLISKARSLDGTRLISAATEITYVKDTMRLDDPLIKYLDIIGVNEYVGWYGGTPESANEKIWKTSYNKPLIISELGAGAKFGLHGKKTERWTEEYQENVYINQIAMLKKIDFLRGMTPWILMDFRSPRRPLPKIQDWFNRKGLISEKGEKKKAFFILQDFYKSIK